MPITASTAPEGQWPAIGRDDDALTVMEQRVQVVAEAIVSLVGLRAVPCHVELERRGCYSSARAACSAMAMTAIVTGGIRPIATVATAAMPSPVEVWRPMVTGCALSAGSRMYI